MTHVTKEIVKNWLNFWRFSFLIPAGYCPDTQTFTFALTSWRTALSLIIWSVIPITFESVIPLVVHYAANSSEIEFSTVDIVNAALDTFSTGTKTHNLPA